MLAWESLWTAAVPLIGLLLLFLAFAWTGLFFVLPGWLHLALLAVFGLAVAVVVWRGARQLGWPDAKTIDRRIETASGLDHRPLSTVQDEPAGGDAVAFSLWQIHKARVLAGLTDLRTGLPGRGALEADPYGLRALAVCGVIVGIFAAGPDRLDRLRASFLPNLSGLPNQPPSLDVWATPPAYTHLPPVALTRLPDGEGMDLPGGTQISVQLSGYPARRAPVLTAPGGVDLSLTRQAEGQWQGETGLPVPEAVQTGDVTVAGRRWPIRLLPDAPPTASFRERPGASPRQALRLPWAAEDDYGLDDVRAEIRLAERKVDPLTLTLATPGRKTAGGIAANDLTDHPWSGLPVIVTLIARDGRGQEGRSEEEHLILPARIFTHPVAKDIIELRRALADEPDSAPEIARALGKLASRPQAFSHDTLVFLGLMATRARLILDETQEELPQVLRTLWDLALRLEEGDLGVLERDLREAEQAVRDGLEQDLTDPEMQQRLDAMQQALDRYMQALTRRAIENAQRNDRPRRPVDPNARMVSNRDIQQMMDKARELARQGQREQAQALLDQLRDLMEQLANSEPQLADGDENGDPSEMDGDPMGQAMQNLQDLARQQRNLMDRGLQQNRQRGQQPGQQGQQPGDMAGEQEALRRRLGDIMRQLGEAMDGMPQGLGKAEQAMRDAQSRLQQGQPGGAAGPQQQALDQLREAMRGLADQQRQQMGQGEGQGQGRGQPRGGQRPGQQTTTGQRDPLGRDRGDQQQGQGQGNDDRVRVPEDSAVERARTIFDDLRRRAADPTRPALERDYLDRLLRGF